MSEHFEDPVECLSITFRLNGETLTLLVDPSESALMCLRDKLGRIGTKEGCGIGECGACTILVDGKAVNSCLTLAAQLDGKEVITVEGLSGNRSGQALQKAFADTGGVQCGFCTPGMLMSSYALVTSNPEPSRDQIVEAISGNLCRCTGYVQIVEAIERASRILLDNDSRHE